MTSESQLAANRRNAALSTGPRTATGKNRSRRNSLKHGLTARSVVEFTESDVEFKAFCSRVAAAYDPRSALDQELIFRLAGLLWRLRRASAIETGLLSIQANLQWDACREQSAHEHRLDDSDPVHIARAFLRSSNFNGDALDRLNRYEVSLWRQTAQILFLLDGIVKPRKARR